ncbi:lycopene beta-cyclase CrtY [Sphingomonas montanisoli]|uniref:Lycopene beta-cyclase CrtY n=1 Tax=Sphingomonas montanisoli TaxID=2606412 RepID=A0A5D9C8A3_9SPHN|nr:lycopene beta-cyclase CrtY [Sphingomonas montanisoli]TZG27310.1 lycopene beta-cyclase CrtY [Sphingomonas montanisoli]
MAEPSVIIAGGGLAGCLVALALYRHRPDLDLMLIEGSDRFGGDHVWSFFDSDLTPAERAFVDDLVVASWPGNRVAFPARQRSLAGSYNSLRSERLDAVIRETLPPASLRLGVPVTRVGPTGVNLADGTILEASCVIDARGAGDMAGLDLGWQKFVGRTYCFARPHGVTLPIIMDATVDQRDGYRFVYCLPFSATEMLVEDTYYADGPALDDHAIGARIAAYVADQGWPAHKTLAEERGVLPVAMGGDVATLWEGADVARLGLRGGFFHPTTGYSLPDAVRNALLLAEQTDMTSAGLCRLFRREAERLWRDRAFYRLLNRMLFRAAEPDRRYRVLEHFYRLDEALIGRFYAGRSTLLDKARILSGRPPVALWRAAAAMTDMKKGRAV